MAKLNFQEELRAAIVGSELIRLVLSKPQAPDDFHASKATIRPIEVSGRIKYQWSSQVGSQVKHTNYSATQLLEALTVAFPHKFLNAHLFTTKADITARAHYSLRNPEASRIDSKRKPPSLAAAVTEHNRTKNYLIPEGTPCPFLEAIGVMNAAGVVRPSMYHKFRQINRYLEFVQEIAHVLPTEGPVHVVDFGCGKSYLTFALHYLFTRIMGREVRMTGLDIKVDVIAHCQELAEQLELEGLSFEVSRIENFKPSGPVHLAVSLHACDTATDRALAGAVGWQANVIMAVPCCQHELNPVLKSEQLGALLTHGLFRERLASLVTDGLRAAWLEVQGYQTDVIEFIDSEHTPKNVLLRSVRRSQSNPEVAELHMARYLALKQAVGVDEMALDSVVTR
jgi:SAM-dependent methyltransferase